MLSPGLRPAEPASDVQMALDPTPSRPSKRRRASSDDEASFLLEGGEAERVQRAISASIQQDMKRRLGCSLKETCADLEAQYPEDGLQQARRRATSELSDFVRSRECTPQLGPQRSPVLGVSPLGTSPFLGAALPPASATALSPSMGGVALPAAAMAGASPSERSLPSASPSFGPAPPPLPCAAASSASPAWQRSPAQRTASAPRSPGGEAELAAEGDGAAAVASQSSMDTSQMYSHDGLLDHEQLMRAIYASQGLDFAAVQNQAQTFLEEMGLKPFDLGVVNTDEHGNTLINQCFYLSIARGYLGHLTSWLETSEMALRLKRAIEAAVLAEHPDWISGGEVGSEAMAFADFLPLAMKASSGENAEMNVLAELAVCVLDSTAGHVEVYLGSKYQDIQEEVVREQNLVLLWYTPGHYQCLVNADEPGSKVMMTYEGFKDVLSKHGVQYIETRE